MKFVWLRDALVRVLFENDEIVAVDKPYGFDTHTNESKAGQAEFVQPGLIELFEKQLGIPLHIVHRLDRTTTGVIVFAKNLAAAKVYQEFFRARETRKTYLFVTAAKSNLEKASCDQPIVRNGDELEASTEFFRLKQQSGFELWKATPKTGRNHQIRIHGAAVGLPLLGDEKYGGQRFPFICLHNSKIEFPNGVAIESTSPRFFNDLSLLKDTTLSHHLVEIENRERLYGRDLREQSLRLIHHQRDSADQRLSLDRFGERYVLSWYQETWTEGHRARYLKLSHILSGSIFVRFMKSKQPAEWLGTHPADTWIAQENQIKYELRTQGLGLYLDQRLQRNWVYQSAKGRSVLNLFSYTGGFSVAAALGGASEIVSVDSNKAMLNWSRENFALNGADALSAVFLCREVGTFLEQSAGKKKFDLVICDPPSFSRLERGVFRIEDEIEGLLKLVLQVGEQVLFSTNSESLFIDDIRKIILKINKNADVTSLQPSLDFESPGEPAGLKSFLISQK
jgi:23S rRNA (cytosine1962-C5)-methyltransferase